MEILVLLKHKMNNDNIKFLDETPSIERHSQSCNDSVDLLIMNKERIPQKADVGLDTLTDLHIKNSFQYANALENMQRVKAVYDQTKQISVHNMSQENNDPDGKMSELMENSRSNERFERRVTQILGKHVKIAPGTEIHHDNSFNANATMKDVISNRAKNTLEETRRKHVCKICGHKFKLSGHLAEHLLIHKGEKPHTCNICGKAFRRKRDMNKHRLLVHKMNKQVQELNEMSSLYNESQHSVHLEVQNNINENESQTRSQYVPRKRKDSRSEMLQQKQTSSCYGKNMCSEKQMSCQLRDVCKINVAKRTDDHRGSETNFSLPTDTSHKQRINIVKVQRITGSERKHGCEVCGFRFKNKGHLKEHLRIHTGQKPYLCKICNKSFSRNSTLKKHGLVHMQKNVKTYHICVKPTKHSEDQNGTEPQYNKNETKHKDDDKSSLKLPNHLHKKKLADHFSKPENVKGHEPSPKYIEIKPEALLKHESKTRKTYTCHICGKLCARIGHLANHMLCHTTVRCCKCPICHKTFKSQRYVEIHMKFHTEVKLYTCEICGRQLRTSSSLKQHMLVHRGEKRYLCEVCGQQYASLASLRTHLKVHEGIKDHLCDWCNKHFFTKDHISAHIQRHLGIKKYSCTVCNKQFFAKSHYNSHMTIHSGIRPHKCKLCSKSFSDSRTLRSHLFSHSGETPFSCSQCNKKFRRIENLKNHKLIHAGKKPHKCCICGKTFRQSGSVGVHMRKVHGKQ